MEGNIKKGSKTEQIMERIKSTKKNEKNEDKLN